MFFLDTMSGAHTVRHIHVRPAPNSPSRTSAYIDVPTSVIGSTSAVDPTWDVHGQDDRSQRFLYSTKTDISYIPYTPYNENAKTDIQIIQLIKNLHDLSPVQRDALIIRYKTTERVLTDRARFYGRSFHWTRGTVTIGSLLVPALLSIQYNTIVSSDAVYWITWFISLLVGICNGVISQYKLDKKYYFLHSILEILHSEAWQYLALSGRYSNGMHGYAVASHQNQYVYFFHSLERIMMKQVEEEYYKLSDLHQQQATRKKSPEESTIGIVDGGGGGSSGGGMERDGEKLDMTGMYIPTPANGTALAPSTALAPTALAPSSALASASIQSPPKIINRRQSVTFSPIMEEKGVTVVDGASTDIKEKGAGP